MSLHHLHFLPFLEYLLIFLFHGGGIIASVHALGRVRTSQGAFAWILALVTFPYVALPAYIVFGRRSLRGYIAALRENKHLAKRYYQYLDKHRVPLSEVAPYFTSICNLSSNQPTRGNATRILVNGNETFDEIFTAIAEAKHYILVQFYIIHADTIGTELKDRLIAKAKEGVKVHLLYDEIGCHDLPKAYLNELRANNIEALPFRETKLRSNRFQINFRNHRKIVIVDGRKAFLGGLNCGDEYLGRSKHFGPWRDTHLLIEGPAAVSVQIAFLEDWLWVAGDIPNLKFESTLHPKNERVLIVPTGPASDNELCGLYFVEAINSAKERLWISSPYVVTDQAVTTALVLAVHRGVEVRILVPKICDHILVYLAGQFYKDFFTKFGVKIYQYDDGFLHQKAILIDQTVSIIGSANLDNRSFRLNFEIIATMFDDESNQALEKILLEDFSKATLLPVDSLAKRPWYFRLAVNFARLFSPIL